MRTDLAAHQHAAPTKIILCPGALHHFNDELMVGVSGEGCRVVRAPYLFPEKHGYGTPDCQGYEW